MAFDTLKTAKRLEEAGFEVAQAESLAGILGESATFKLATKDDFCDAEKRSSREIKTLDTKIDQVGERLTAKIDQVGERLTAKVDQVEERLTAKIEKQGIDVGNQIADLKADIAAGQNSLQRWMIGLTISLFIGVGGMILAYFAS